MLPIVDVHLDEGVPLLCSHQCNNSIELAAVHTVKTSSKRQTQNDKQDLTDRIVLSIYDRVNVIEALHAFWQKKQFGDSDVGSLVLFLTEPSIASTSVCYVTLPGGCCFASPQECVSSAEARRSAAHVALVNSVFNELPSRRVTPSFIASAVQEASLTAVSALTSDGQPGIDAYQFVLESAIGQTVLELATLVNKLRVMHWSGALHAMYVHGATRQDLLRTALSSHWVSEDYRSEMALRWMAIERRTAGSIDAELKKAIGEIETARRQGRELAFPRLKRDVLQLAASQV